MRRWRLAVMMAMFAVLPAAAADAAFPGVPGRLALLVSEAGGSDTDIYTVEPDGTDLVKVTSDGGRKTSVRWSPDGTRIAFVAASETGSSVLIVPGAGGAYETAYGVMAPYFIRSISWSVDGQEIAVLWEAKAGLQEVSIVAADGSDSRHLVAFNSVNGEHVIDWSPAGDTLALSVSEPGADAPRVALLRLDGSQPEPLVAGVTPSWSPSGDSLVFVGEGGTSVIDVDGSDLRVIPGLEFGEPPGPGLGVGYYPLWSPAGEEVAVISFGGLSADIVDVATGTRRAVFGDGGLHVAGLDWQRAPAPGGFIDVSPDSSFAADIQWLAEAGVTRGCNPPVNDEFCPTMNVTRGQMAAFLVRALGLPGVGDADFFGDDDESIFEAEIDMLAAAGITRGCNPPVNDEFCPTMDVTRGQMAAFLVRALGLPGVGDADFFGDDDESIFEAEIDMLAAAGITRGCNPPVNDQFCPRRPVTRAEAAAFLHRSQSWLPRSRRSRIAG